MHKYHKDSTKAAFLFMQKFHLNQSCIHGLLLSVNMDGFALPPFESISFLKDKDVISVQKMDHLTIGGSDTTDQVEARKIMAMDCVINGTLILENEEFDKESGGYKREESDDESAKEHEESRLESNDHIGDGNGIFKKSQKLQGSNTRHRQKKQRSEPRETVVTEIPRESEYTSVPHENKVPIEKKSKAKKGKSSKNDNLNTGGANSGHDEKTIKDVESASNLKINEQFREKDEDVDDGATNISGSTQKCPSRSARCQYAKRRMLREMKKIQENNVDSPSKEVKKWKRKQIKAEKRAGPDQMYNEGFDQPKGLLHWKQFGGKDIFKARIKPEEDNQSHKAHGYSNKDMNASNEVIPIEIRPRHILFEVFKEDQELQQSQVSLETLQWNGIISRKKGKKWGTDKGSTCCQNNYELKEANLENIIASEWSDLTKASASYRNA